MKKRSYIFLVLLISFGFCVPQQHFPLSQDENKFQLIGYTYNNQELPKNKLQFLSPNENTSTLEILIDSVEQARFKTQLTLRNTSTDTLIFNRVRNSTSRCFISTQYPKIVPPDSLFVIKGNFNTRSVARLNTRSQIQYSYGNNKPYHLFILTKTNLFLKR